MAEDIPEDAPEHCPGTESSSAGKASACEGCPNQKVCASGEANLPDPDLPKIAENLSSVKHKILVLSGKGGVGKSTVTSNITRGLAEDKSKDIGILDIDICGPSIPRIMGVLDEQVHNSGSGWSPVYADENICLMSSAFLLASLKDAIIWRGPKKNGLIKQFLRDVDWGSLDYLVIDTPPGTSDEHLSVLKFLEQVGIDGAVIVTTPQEVALLDVRKQINFCKKTKIPLIGVVANMKDFFCPKCKKSSAIFQEVDGGVSGMASEMNIPYLGSIPLDPTIGKCCDEGKSIFEEYPDSPLTKAYRDLTAKVAAFCENDMEVEEQN